MKSGRAPAIVSDDWEPPAGPDWESFSVRIAERDIERVPEILEARRDSRHVVCPSLQGDALPKQFARPYRTSLGQPPGEALQAGRTPTAPRPRPPVSFG